MFGREIVQLAAAVRREVTKYKAENCVPTQGYARIRRRDLTLKYRENFGFAYFTPERIEGEAWEPNDRQQFETSLIKRLEEYKSVVSILGPKAGLVEAFLSSLCIASFHGMSDEVMEERAAAFDREVQGLPLPAVITAFIDGLSIFESPLVISNNVILRHPTPEDVSEYKILDQEGEFSFPLGETWFRVVGEFCFEAPNGGIAQEQFLRTIEALRLFRVAGVASSRYSIRLTNALLNQGGVISGGGLKISRFICKLSKADAVTLNKFLSDIMPQLPDPCHLHEALSEREIAYTRYRDALFQDGPSERAITFAINALEALFLENEGELKRRLAQRVSVFLRILGHQVNADITHENITRGYRIRSTFVHGSSSKLEDREADDILAPVLLEYARVCTLAFFQIKIKKRALVTELDKTMIDPGNEAVVKDALAAVLHK